MYDLPPEDGACFVAASVAVLGRAPASGPQMHRQKPQIAAALAHGDVRAPALEGAAVPERREVGVAAPGEAAADGEAGREMADLRVGPVPAAARARHRRTGRHRHLPGRWREDAARRRFVLDFLEGDDIGIQGGDLARDGVVVGLGAAHATFPVGVVEVLQVPGGDAQLARVSRRCRRAKRNKEQEGKESDRGGGLAPKRWIGAGGAGAGRDAVLAEAAASHAHSRFPALLAQARGGPSELTVAGLKAAGSLPAEFSEVDALGRGYRVLILGAGPDAFDMLVSETVTAGDTVRPAAALLEAPGPGVGLAGPSRLSGPTVEADVSGFRTAFAGAPAEGALAALRRFDHGSVYGDALYRVAIPGFDAANRMEADLDMGGNAIEGAGRIEAASLEVETDLEAGGDLSVTGDLLVGRGVRAAGTVEAGERIAAAAARIEGLATSGSMAVSGAVRAQTVEAAGRVEAGSIGAVGAVAAGSARLGGLDAATVTARTVTAGSVSASSATAARMRFDGRLDADSAGFSRLTVGLCQGCR